MSKHNKTNLSSKKKTKAKKSKTRISRDREAQDTKEVEDDQELTQSINSNENTHETEDTVSLNLDAANKEKTSSDKDSFKNKLCSTNQDKAENSILIKKAPVNKETEVIRLSTSDDYSNVSTEQSSKKDTTELFNAVHSGQVVPILPSRAWAIHCTEGPERYIVISELSVHNENGIGLVPLSVKQIIFDDKMNYELYLINSRVVVKNKPCIVETIADVMHVIAYTHNLKVCIGGPEVISYGSVNLECAYKDPRNRWRHNLCTLEVAEEGVCESCAMLDEVLQKQIQKCRLVTKRKRAM